MTIAIDPPSPLKRKLLRVIGNNGGYSEASLAVIAFAHAVILLLVPQAIYLTVATIDIAYLGLGWILPIVFLLVAGLGGSGMILATLHLWRHVAKWLRFGGAFIGNFVWWFYAANLAHHEDIGAIGFLFCVWAAVTSIRIMGSTGGE